MMAVIRVFSLVLFSLVFTLSLFSQTVMFTGVVQDTASAPVQGATVVFRNTKTGAERTVSTNSEGRFSVGMTGDPSDHSVIVHAKGFARVTQPVTTDNTTITLSPRQVSEEVTVTATRTQVLASETAVPVSIVGRDEIDRKAVNTISDIFRTLPGTSTVNEGAFQVRPRIRGLDSNRVLILVDGERLNNSRTSTAQSGIEPGLVETSQIESVEVLRGSGSVLYGTDALAGTINIITRDTPPRRDGGLRLGAVLDTFYSSNENGRRGSLAINGSNNFFAFRLSQSLERSGNYFTGKNDGIVPVAIAAIGGITSNGEVLNSQSHAGNTNGTARVFMNDTSTIKMNFERRRAANVGSAALVGTFNGFFPFTNRDKLSGRYDTGALTSNLQRLSISGFYQEQKRNFTNILTVNPAPPFFPGLFQTSETVTNTETSGFDVQTDWKFGSRHLLTAGASFFNDVNADRRKVTTKTTSASTTQSVSNTKSVPNASLSNISTFVQNEFRVTNRFKFVGGVRIDNFRTNAEPTAGFSIPTLRQDQIDDLQIGGLASGLKLSKTSVTGDFGAVIRVTPDIALSSRVGRSFRTPNIFELFFTDAGSVGGFVVGNPNLKPETGTNFDTSVKIRKAKFSVSATYFRNSYKNFLNTREAKDSRGCPIFITQPGTVFDANNCNIVSFPPGRTPVRVSQTQNIDKALIQGFEAEFEAPIMISFGYLTPNANVSYLRGDNTVKNVPLDVISPLRTNIGLRWNNFGKAYFFNYDVRIVARQTRLSSTFLLPVNQGGNGGPEPGFVTHNSSGGYYFRRERFNFNVNLGISNLFNRAYNEQFVYAPARGRSFTIGTTWEIR
jgi:outer membrane receptor protein involved in Fe transport